MEMNCIQHAESSSVSTRFTLTDSISASVSPSSSTSADKFSFRSLIRYVNQMDQIFLVFGILFAVLQGCISGIYTLIFRMLTDVLISGQEAWTNGTFNEEKFSEDAQEVVYTYFSFGTAIFIFSFFSTTCWHTFGERQVYKIRNAYFKSLLGQDAEWFDSHDSGETTIRMSDGFERVRDGISEKLGIMISSVTHCICGLSIAFFLSWKISLVMLSFTPVYLGPTIFFSKMISKSTPKEVEAAEAAGSTAGEGISGIKTVISFNGEQREIERYSKCLSEVMRWGLKRVFYQTSLSAFVHLATFTSMALSFWYGIRMMIDGSITPGTTFAVFWAVSGSIHSLSLAAPQIQVFLTCHSAAAPIFKIIDREIPIDGNSNDGIKIENVKGSVKFKNVCFKYPSRPEVNVLNNVSLYANPGENIALVGHSGSGKSTLASLMMRFYDVDNGVISIDDLNIEDLNLCHLRNLIGIVSQEPLLFVDTVENNVRLGAPELSDDEVEYYCRLANAHDFIEQLPSGYKTIIGKGGVELSGGQRQRVAIARTLARKYDQEVQYNIIVNPRPSVLILDEATSALDSVSEALVQEALENAKKDRTTITIAHRLSTIRNCTRIYVFDHGSVVEVGSHEELMMKKGYYSKMVQTQELEIEHDSIENELSTISKRKTVDKESSQKRDTKRLSKVLSDTSEVLISDISRLEDYENQRDQSNFLEILRFAKPEWIILFVAILVSILRGFQSPIFSILYGRMFQILSTGTNDEKIYNSEMNSYFFVILGFSSAVVTLGAGCLMGYAGERLTKRLRIGLFSNILKQDGEYFDLPEHAPGRLLTRLATDAPNIRAAIDQRLAEVFQGVSAIICGTAIAIWYSPKMALIGLVNVGFLISLQGIIIHILKKRGEKDSVGAEEPFRLAIETVEQYRTVQYLTRENHFVRKFIDGMKPIHRRNLQRGIIQSISYALSVSYTFFSFAIGYRYGIYLIVAKLTSPFIIFQVIESLNTIGPSISALGTYMPEYVRARVSAGLLFRMLRDKPKIDSCIDIGKKISLKGDVSLKNVYFGYKSSGRKMVLRDLSLKINKGKTTAIVGASGCGKSTLVQILERFYDPVSGNVEYDNECLKDLNLKHLRSQIALVEQQPTLFNYSIRENIAYGLEKVTEEEVIDAARLANAHEFITNMPQGYDTIVGEGGNKLSGGQKQRIAIARAMIRKPKILLLDEATSALDVESEKLVQMAMETAKEGKTCIVIAHRLSTIRGADTIVVIKKGRVIEQGTHQQLLLLDEEYAKFVQKALL